MTASAEYCWLDGDFLAWEEGNIHLLTHSLHYGLAVFEGTRAYAQETGGSAVFRLEDHLRRLQRSAHIMQMEMPYDLATLSRATLDLIAKNNLESCYIRHLAFVGDGVMGLHPQDNPIRVAILAWPWGAYLGDDAIKNGIRCRVSSFVRHFPNSMMNKAKASGNYLNSILAKREVVAQGYDEAILLDTQGFVAEGSGENIFVIANGVIYTPPLTSALAGITRATVIELARKRGYEINESYLSRDELYVADEIFFTGTAAEITPVREIDDRQIGNGTPGPITQTLQTAYFDVVAGKDEAYAHWLSPIPLAVA